MLSAVERLNSMTNPGIPGCNGRFLFISIWDECPVGLGSGETIQKAWPNWYELQMTENKFNRIVYTRTHLLV
jgi:hypothetical protein